MGVDQMRSRWQFVAGIMFAAISGCIFALTFFWAVRATSQQTEKSRAHIVISIPTPFQRSLMDKRHIDIFEFRLRDEEYLIAVGADCVAMCRK